MSIWGGMRLKAIEFTRSAAGESPPPADQVVFCTECGAKLASPQAAVCVQCGSAVVGQGPQQGTLVTSPGSSHADLWACLIVGLVTLLAYALFLLAALVDVVSLAVVATALQVLGVPLVLCGYVFAGLKRTRRGTSGRRLGLAALVSGLILFAAGILILTRL